MSKIKLFTLINGDIVINKVELLTLKPFRDIIRRDHGSEGDADGRKKYQAFKELCYVYHIADVASVPNKQGYNHKESVKYAITKSELDDTWKPDETIVEAITAYKEEQSSISTDSISELLKTFRYTNDVVKKLRKNIELQLDKPTITNEEANSIMGIIQNLIKFGKDIPKLSRDLTTAINELHEDSDDKDVELLRGSKEAIPMSANPDSDY